MRAVDLNIPHVNMDEFYGGSKHQPQMREIWPHARLMKVQKGERITGSWGNLGTIHSKSGYDCSPDLGRRYGSTRIKKGRRIERFPSEPDSNVGADLLRSYSSSSVAHYGVFEAPGSCQTTPKAIRRGSKFPVLKRLSSSSGPTANNAQNDKYRSKSQGSDHAMYMAFVSDAKKQRVLTENDEKLWAIQENFPNDDLRLYEGALISMASPKLSSPEIQDDIVMLDEHDCVEHVVCNGFTDTDQNFNFYSPVATPEPVRSVRFGSSPQDVAPGLNSQQSHLTVLSKFSPAIQAKFKKMAQRRQSAPSLVIRGVLNKSKSSPFTHSFGSSFGKDSSCDSLSGVESLPLSLKFGSHGAVLNLAKRTYVMEGKVHLTRGVQTQERYLFLFTDLLLIAKAKSGSNYKLKSRVRVCELWTAACQDDVSENATSPDTSFVIGWPATNFVASFSSPESKDLWHEAITKRITIEKEKESPKTSTISTVRRDGQGLSENNTKSVTISHKHSTRDVVRIILSEFKIEAKEDDYQLWTMSRKDGSAYPLIGHEYPHAIHMSAIRDSITSTHPLYERDVTCMTENDPLLTSCTCDKYQFILRLTKQISKMSFDQSQRRLMRIKNKTPAAFFSWARKRHLSSRNNENSMLSTSANYDSCESTNSTPGTPKLFARPLKLICEEGEIPTPIECILRILHRKGPFTTGIFRKSAAARTTKLLKDKLNEDLDVDLRDAPIHVLAALLKNFLRNIPDSLLDCARYDDWSNAIDKATDEEKMQAITEILMELDLTNKILLRRICALLNKIASNSEHNSMTVFNLSVCIAPSMLWTPPTAGPFTLADSSRKVAEIIQFILNNEFGVFNKILNEGYIEWPVGEESPDVSDDDITEPEIANASESSAEELTVQSDNETDQVKEIDSFNRSRHFRRQLQRRKPVNKPEGVTILSRRASSSLDSLDLLEVDVPSSFTSTSNDSGFTTLSGEDDDVVYSTNSTAPTSIPTVANTGLNLSTSVYCSTSTVKPSNMEDVKIAAEELRNLWSPDFLLDGSSEMFSNEITPQQEMLIFDEEEYESRDIVMDFDAKKFKHSPRIVRRFSAPQPTENREYTGDTLSSNENEGTIFEDLTCEDSSNTSPLVKNYLEELRNAPTKSFFENSFSSSIQSDEECDETECLQNDENNNSTSSDSSKTLSRPNTLKIDNNTISLQSHDKQLPNTGEIDCHEFTVHANHTTACLDYHQHSQPQTMSLPRKAHSMREGKAASPRASNEESTENGVLSPIQKLTLNLHSLPDFRAKSKRNRDSPLNKGRCRKSESNKTRDDHNQGSLLQPEKSKIVENETNEFKNVSSSNKSVTPTNKRSRRQRNKFAQFNSGMSADGASLFSFSVPSTGWAHESKQEEPSENSFISQKEGARKTVKYDKVLPGTTENSVKEKVQAFNLLISDQSSDKSNATYVPLDSILADYGTNSKIVQSQKRPSIQNNITINCEHNGTPPPSTKNLNTIPLVSDDMLHTLTESFAFGNRKSPRNLTPLHTPGCSPSIRRRQSEHCITHQISSSLNNSLILSTRNQKARDDSILNKTTFGAIMNTNDHVFPNKLIFAEVDDESYV